MAKSNKGSISARKRGGLSDNVSDIVLLVICAAVMLIVAYPLYYVLVASFSDPYDVYAGKTFLLPSQFTLKGYQAVFADSALFSGFMNSIKYTVIGTIYSVVMIYLVAYPLSVRDLPGRKYISLFFVITMYFGGGLVPTYLIVKETGLLGNIWALFLPGVVAVGHVIIVRNFFENNIPRELLEAAEIDGASKWTVFIRMIVPLSRSIMAVMVVYSMVAYWNDWFNSLLYIQQKKVLQPLQALLMELQNNTEYLNRMAGMLGPDAIAEAAKMPSQALRMVLVVFIVVPIACAYPFFQRYIVSGLTVGSVKG